MNPDEIRDQDSLERWLKGRHADDSLQIVIRSALRVFPIFGRAMDRPWARNLTALPVLRCLLAVEVRRKYPTPEVMAAANAAGTSSAVNEACDAAAKANALTTERVFNSNAPSAAADPRSAGDTAAANAHAVASNAIMAPNADPYAAVLAAHAFSGEMFIWEQIREDARKIGRGQDTMSARLWSIPQPPWFQQVDRETRVIWANDPSGTWDFWLRWWDGVLEAKRVNPGLLRDIVLLPNEHWERGPAHIATLIAEIEGAYPFFGGYVEEGYFDKKYVDQDAGQSKILPELDTLVACIPFATLHQIQTTRQAIITNREALPPTFDAVEGLLLLEIARLQGRNFTDELDQAETVRQIGLYLLLYEAIGLLRSELPANDVVSEAQAEKSERVLRVYCRKFAELPLAKADEVVEGFWSTGRGIVQAGLIGATATLGVSYGLPALAAVSIGAIVFAPKNAAELIKATKEALGLK